MRTMTVSSNGEVKEGQKFIAFICNKIYKLITSISPEAVQELDRDNQFAAYVNNRMFVLIMWTKHLKARSPEGKAQILNFLNDMYHHFVDPYAGRKVRLAFKWLMTYVELYPNVAKKDRYQAALKNIEIVYDALEVNFPMKQQMVC